MKTKVVNLVTSACLLLTLQGCIDLTGERYARQQAALAREPYYGSGVVTHVIRPDLVDVSFGQSRLPLPGAKLIIVHSNAVVAKVEFNGGGFDKYYICEVLEGTPKVGDSALGWQREADFIDPRAKRKSNQPLQPTAVR